MNPPDNPHEAPAPESYKVLLEDDQTMIGEAVRRAQIGQPQLQLHYCGNPAEALQVAERIQPTVILQDLVMPGMDGLSLVRQYRAHPATRDIPIIVLSTKEEPAIKSEAFAQGANDYLVKLPDKVELIARRATTRAPTWASCSATLPSAPCAKASSSSPKPTWNWCA
jgi:two-component system chemotaxis family response regulator WspR